MTPQEIEIKELYPHIPIETNKDRLLIIEAQKYNNVKWLRIDKDHWDYLQEYLRMKNTHQEWTWKFFHHGLMGQMYMFNAWTDYIDLWVWVDEEQDNLEQWFYKEIMLKSDWLREGLIKALDPNYGGIFDGERKEIASLIIFG